MCNLHKDEDFSFQAGYEIIECALRRGEGFATFVFALLIRSLCGLCRSLMRPVCVNSPNLR